MDFWSDEDHFLYSKNAQDGSTIFLILYVLAELVWKLRLKFVVNNLDHA